MGNSLLSGYSWPGWETVGILGKGGFGAVYEIHRQIFDATEKAAMKVISIPQNEGEITELYNDGYTKESIVTVYKSHLKRIVDEYSVMRLLSSYPNIVNCDDVRYEPHEDGIGWDIYIKMELLTPLAKALPQQIPEATVVKLATDLCKALEACQEHKLLHRDIKPQNIFVSPDGTYKLGDFGIAKTIEKTTGGTKIGTYRYMAPEVYNNKPYGMSSDIYSLGLVLYWLLNNRRMPFLPLPPAVPLHTEEEEAKARRFSGEPLPAPAHGSARLQQIVLKACAFSPADRYHSAAQLRADLESLPAVPAAAVPLPATKTSAEKSQTCQHCGKPLLPNAKFCKFCGTSSLPVAPIKNDPPPAKNPVSADKTGSSAGSSKSPPPIANVAEEKKKKKRYLLPIFLSIVAILCIGGIVFGLFPLVNKLSSAPKDWSQWTDTLPESVSSEDYIIEEQVLYRTRSLETTTSDSPTLEGWDLTDTTDGAEQLGQWSDWTEEKPTASETLEVEEQTRYRYREKETTTGSSSSKSGWTLDPNATTYTYGNYGNWSGWNTTAAYDSNTRDAESKTQYRYRTLNYTTSTSSSLSGWTRYDSSTSYGSWGNWSSWSSNYISDSDTRDVDTRYIEPTYRTEYNYSRYTQYDTSVTGGRYGWAGPAKGYWSDIYCQYYQERGWSTEKLTYVGSDSGFDKYSGNGAWYNEQTRQVQVTEGYTQYRYRDRSKTTTYYYQQWGSWSGWGDTYYSETSSRDVETRTVYRYRDRSQISTYHFWRWKDWEDWSDTKPSAANNREIEEKKFYRTRSHTPTKIYHFQRWTDWTDWSSEAAESSGTLQVEKIIQYRYKPK